MSSQNCKHVAKENSWEVNIRLVYHVPDFHTSAVIGFGPIFKNTFVLVNKENMKYSVILLL